MALRFPSLDYLLTQARQSFMRFPLTIIASLVAVTIAVYLVETEDQTFNRLPYINAMLCAALGIPLYFCVAILAARQQFNLRNKLITQGLATLVLVAIYFTLPDASSTHNTSLPYIRYGLYNIIAHLLVSFVPYLFVQQLNGFWNYNKTLFLRFLTSLLYSAFLYIGLVLALFALQTLFELDIHDKLYADLFIVIGGFFNTWFFVAGVPLNFEELQHVTNYPKGLKIFSQYVLLPLLLLYLLILYGYGIKIIISWDWPKGIVSYLIMCVSVLGILTMLLIYPYALYTENRWIRKVTKAYYLLLLPLLILLFLAIGMRLADYGFTINRYIILAVGIWLSIICLYFLSGKSNIKFVPISLAVLLLLISLGPWSIFSVSERDQAGRLETILSSGSILESGKVAEEVSWVKDSLPTFYSPEENRNDGILGDSLHNEVLSIIDYLDDYHGYTSIQPWYRQNLDSMIVVVEADTSYEGRRWVSEARIYMETLGLPYQRKYKDNSGYRYFTYSSQANVLLEVSGYERVVFFGEFYPRFEYKQPGNADPKATDMTIKAGQKDFTISYAPDEPEWLSIYNEKDTLRFPLKKLSKGLTKTYKQEDRTELPVESMSLNLQHGDQKYKLVLESISLNAEGDSLSLQSMNAYLLIGRKD